MKPPIPNSYWVEPGVLLAGEHPDGGSEAATRERLAVLLAAGVRGFIDLTEPHELPGYSSMLPGHAAYHSFPLPDHSVPRAAQQMRDVQRTLEKLLAAGTPVYVHCRAGIGRTGITIGCYLREQGQAPEGALSELNRLWQQNARAERWPITPETEEQEQYILAWDPQSRTSRSPQGVDLLQMQSGTLARYRGCLMGLAIADVSATAPAGRASGWSDQTAWCSARPKACSRAADSMVATRSTGSANGSRTPWPTAPRQAPHPAPRCARC